jgi:hypothetical protein
MSFFKFKKKKGSSDTHHHSHSQSKKKSKEKKDEDDTNDENDQDEEEEEEEEEDDDTNVKQNEKNVLKKTINNLNPEAIILGTVVFVVTRSWQDTFSAALDKIYPVSDGKNIGSRIAFSAALTTAAFFVVKELDFVQNRARRKQQQKMRKSTKHSEERPQKSKSKRTRAKPSSFSSDEDHDPPRHDYCNDSPFSSSTQFPSSWFRTRK